MDKQLDDAGGLRHVRLKFFGMLAEVIEEVAPLFTSTRVFFAFRRLVGNQVRVASFYTLVNRVPTLFDRRQRDADGTREFLVRLTQKRPSQKRLLSGSQAEPPWCVHEEHGKHGAVATHGLFPRHAD